MLVRGPERGIPYELTGDLSSGIERALPNAQVTGIALEFGTYELDRMLDLLIADCWVHNYGNPGTTPGRELRAQLQEFFYPGTPAWLDAITDRAQQVIRRFLAGLAAT